MAMTGKQLHHIIRLYQFILNIVSGYTFKYSLTYFDDIVRDMCMKAFSPTSNPKSQHHK